MNLDVFRPRFAFNLQDDFYVPLLTDICVTKGCVQVIKVVLDFNDLAFELVRGTGLDELHQSLHYHDYRTRVIDYYGTAQQVFQVVDARNDLFVFIVLFFEFGE